MVAALDKLHHLFGAALYANDTHTPLVELNRLTLCNSPGRTRYDLGCQDTSNLCSLFTLILLMCDLYRGSETDQGVQVHRATERTTTLL
jgi:hypothetical protein